MLFDLPRVSLFVSFRRLWFCCCTIVFLIYFWKDLGCSSVSLLTPWRDNVSSHLFTLLIHSQAVCYRRCLLLSLLSCIGINYSKSIQCPLLPFSIDSRCWFENRGSAQKIVQNSTKQWRLTTPKKHSIDPISNPSRISWFMSHKVGHYHL